MARSGSALCRARGFRPSLSGSGTRSHVNGGDCALQCIGSGLTRSKRAFDQCRAFCDQAGVPTVSVLINQQDDLTFRRYSRCLARLVQHHQSQQAKHLAIGQEVRNQPPQPDRLPAHLRKVRGLFRHVVIKEMLHGPPRAAFHLIL